MPFFSFFIELYRRSIFFEAPDGAELAALLAQYHYRQKGAEIVLNAWLTDETGSFNSFSAYVDMPAPKNATEREKEAAEDKQRIRTYVEKTKANYAAIHSRTK